MHMHLIVHDVDLRVSVIVVAHMAWDACVECIVPHMPVCTCETGVVSNVFTHVGDTCEVFISVVARMSIRYGGVLHVCV